VTKDDPIPAINDRDLKESLEDQIRPASVVLIPAGMYTHLNNSKWINAEIKIAKAFPKPIIAIKPWGALIFPREIIKEADETVGWNGSSIVDAIKRLAN
jgi:hypothetical protein